MIIRQATASDLDTIIAMRQERSRWLAGQGSDQWQVGLTTDGFAERVRTSIAAGQTYMAVDEHGEVLGTIAIDTWTNPGLWSEQDLAESVIVHRMITWRHAAGQGVGNVLLELANKVALRAGRRWVRLDAWTSNNGLHDYYRSAGFRHVRTIDEHQSKSTALFEREAAVQLPVAVRRLADLGIGLADASAPAELYNVLGLQVRRPSALGDSPQLELISGDTWRLWSEAGDWLLAPIGRGYLACAVVEWDLAAWLNEACEYVITHVQPSAAFVLMLGPESGRSTMEFSKIRKT